MLRRDPVRRITIQYTIACICARKIEWESVLCMLDAIHESPFTLRDNAYTFGRIHSHNVVVANIMDSADTSAATTLTWLMNDLPSIRFALLVGIGGGVPGDKEENDVRLGDVVVSQPANGFGGVVQLASPKNGQIERIGHLNEPPSILRTAIEKIQAKHRSVESQISRYVAGMTQRSPKRLSQYSFPGREHDQLFLPWYPHVSGPTCDHCDVSQTVSRNARSKNDPEVHYGTIGSGNFVVKDPTVRDALKRDMNILCIEMDAAGLMNTFPCLIIRGICDYADSHKNQRWQPYAAAVAAAYMKELLMVIPVPQSLGADEAPVKGKHFHPIVRTEI